MIISGLKIQIAITIFILMAFALLIGNIVAVMFWQKEMVVTEIDHAGAVLEHVQVYESLEAGNRSARDLSLDGELDTICRLIGDNCISSGYFDGKQLMGGRFGDLQSEALALARNAFLLNEQTERLVGSMWGVFYASSRYLLVASPRGGKTVGAGAAVVAIELGSIYENIRDNHRLIFIYLILNICLLTILGMYRMVNLIVAPIDRMVKISDKFEASDDSLFFSGDLGSSEFARLNRALNSMLIKIEADKNRLRKTIQSLEESNEQLVRAHRDVVRAEKLASVGRLSAGLAHEIGNPIGIVQGYVELMQQRETDQQDRLQYAERALQELDRINQLIRRLLDYAGSSSQDAREIEINDNLFAIVLDLVAMENKGQGVVIETALEPGLSVMMDRGGLQQVLLNCLLNSFDALPAARGEAGGDGVIAIKAAKTSDAADQNNAYVTITIEDNGLGIEADMLEKVFDPFVTSKELGKGTGLGLFVCHNILELHGGTIRVENNEQGGTTVSITLPLFNAGVDNEH